MGRRARKRHGADQAIRVGHTRDADCEARAPRRLPLLLGRRAERAHELATDLTAAGRLGAAAWRRAALPRDGPHAGGAGEHQPRAGERPRPPARPGPRRGASPASSTASERAEEPPVSPSTEARGQPAADTSEPRVERQAPDLPAAGAARIAPTAALPEPTPVAAPVRQETAEPSHMEPQGSQPDEPTTPTAGAGQTPAHDLAAGRTSGLGTLRA